MSKIYTVPNRGSSCSGSSLGSSYYINDASLGSSHPSASNSSGTYVIVSGTGGKSSTSESSIRRGGNNGEMLYQYRGNFQSKSKP